jgi:hypothetical protein
MKNFWDEINNPKILTVDGLRFEKSLVNQVVTINNDQKNYPLVITLLFDGD